MQRILILLCILSLTGCVTSVPDGWGQARQGTITEIIESTNGMLDSTTTEDKDFLFTVGVVGATAYDATALSLESKPARMLYAIESTCNFAELLTPKRDVTKVLRACYGSEASDAELWIAFITHQVRQLRLQRSNQ